MNAAELLVACLEREGVDHAFGVPGEEMEALLFALRDSDVQFVPVRHEQGAAFVADVHGRLTGEAGVCVSTLGPGATNLLTGVADAHLDKSPLVAITAQGSLDRLHQESHQAIDVVDTFDPVTKWNAQLNDPDIVHEAVRKAFKLAEHEKPGATHLELPEDVAGEATDERPLQVGKRVRHGPPSVGSLDRLTGALRDADRPLLVAGNGVIRAGASPALRDLAATSGLPVVSTYMGKGAVSDADANSLMTLDSGPADGAAGALREADLLLAVGYDTAEHDPDEWEHEGATLVHVDSEPAEVYEAYTPDVEVVADIDRTLRALTEWWEGASVTFETGWYDGIRERIVDHVDRNPPDSAPFTVRSVLPDVRAAMDAGAVLVSDVGSHKMAIAQEFPTYEPNTCIVSNGFASMGIAVPGGIAADLAVDQDVVVATGDGGFLMNAAELETAKRLGCTYTVVVFVDDDYGLISEQQRASTGASFGTELTNPDLVAFAESFGIDGYRPDTAAELRSVLDGVVPSDDLSLVEVPVE